MSTQRNEDEIFAARRRGRRQFMVGGAATGAGLAAGMIADAQPADAAGGPSVHLGQANIAAATTSVSTTNGSGLQGKATVDGRVGVEGIDASSGGAFGVFGSSTKGTGVLGTSTAGTGVYGTSATGPGVEGECDAFEGVGVSGVTSGKFAYGVKGLANAPVGFCVGVLGKTNSNPGAVGVYGYAEKGIALFAYGDASVSGSLSKGGGSFKIDHPLDPAHKYLYHSFVESPDMMNVYNGTVVLDSTGQATVELPEWFETLNRDFRYQVTAIGAAAPDLHVAGEVADAAFSIAGGRPGLKVSWQVTGIRQDAWANAHRIPVEADKAAEDQGRYLHPDLYEDGHGEPVEAITLGRRRA